MPTTAPFATTTKATATPAPAPARDPEVERDPEIEGRIKAPLAGGVWLRWTKGAQYRLGKVEQPGTFDDLQAGGPRMFSALADFVWAAQDEKPRRFAAAEDVIEHLVPETLVGVMQAFVAAWLASLPAEDRADDAGTGTGEGTGEGGAAKKAHAPSSPTASGRG